MESYGKHSKIGDIFGIGIIGLGEGKGLVKGLCGHPELPVRAVCDSNEDLLHKIQTEYQVPHSYNRLEEMLRREDIRIVVIYTPDQLHLSHIIACLSAGKHVICTKPLVTSLEEAKKLLEIQIQYPKLSIMVGQSSRFFGSMQKQRKVYEKRGLGELVFAETQYVHDMRWFYENRSWAKTGGFDLLFAGNSHPIDLIRWYMGDAREVHAFADRSIIAKNSDFSGNDIFVINLKFQNGKIGRVLGLYGLEQPHQFRPWIEVALYGTEGTFIAKYPQLESIVKIREEDERKESYFEDTYHYFQFEGVNHHAGEFVNYTEYFARCLVKGERAMPDALDGFKTIATLEAIRESARSGTGIQVQNEP
jgi:predicted dehydrogenase